MKISTLLVFAALLLSVSATPARATYPGANGKIAFVGNQSGTWQLYTINPDGSDIDQITNLPPTNLELWLPAFSPDGKRIIFAHDSPGHLCAPRVYPPVGCVDLFVVDADGNNLNRLTNDGSSFLPKWSPDGGSVVFARISPGTNEPVIATLNIARRKVTELTSRFWQSYVPTYTPDATKIVFGSQLGGLVSAVWTMNRDGSDQDRITPAALAGVPLDVSPDGRHLLVINNYNSTLPNQIFTMDLDGKHLVPITSTRNAHNIPGTYSPDGKAIVFTSDRFSSDFSLDLFTMNADGSDQKRIASGLTVGGCPDGNCVGPAWGAKPH